MISNFSLIFLVPFFLSELFTTNAQDKPSDKKPVIGIVTTPSDFKDLYDPGDYSYMKHSYAELVEEGGGRPVVIPWDIKEEDLMSLLNSVNGVLFTGGDTALAVKDPDSGDLVLSSYALRAKQIINYVIDLFDKGQVFPVLGVCQGPQVITMALSDDPNLIAGYDHEKAFDYIFFEESGRKSRMFSYYPAHLFDFLEQNKACYFEHSLGIKPTTVAENPKLRDFFNVIATSKDDKGRPLIAALEGKQHPFYLVQYHPEIILQEYRNKGELEKSRDDFQSIYLIARFFVDEARKNNHVFPEDDENLKRFHVKNGERAYINKQWFDVYFYKKWDIYPDQISFQDFKVLRKLKLA